MLIQQFWVTWGPLVGPKFVLCEISSYSFFFLVFTPIGGDLTPDNVKRRNERNIPEEASIK